MRLLLVPAVLALLLREGTGVAAESRAVQIGQKIAPLTLKDTNGKVWPGQDLKSAKAVVIVFIGTECPISNAFMSSLAQLHGTYGPRGVQFLAVNANRQDTAQRIAEHAKQHAIPFPVVKDEGNIIADRFGARRTPEAFLLDSENVLRYGGRIDDQFGVGFKRIAPSRRDLAEAIEEVLAGKPVTQPITPVAGCLIARAVSPKKDATITYTKHVAGIVQKNCQECHRPGQIAPMSLLTYDDVVAWSETIREVIKDMRMPPWHADPRYGRFENDRRLSAVERETLLTWIERGCSYGNKEDLPPPRQFAEGWRIGKPDVVLSMPQEFRVPAEAPKRGLKYQYIIVPTRFTEDKWIQAAEVKPGNRAVVHHIIAYIGTPDKLIRDPNDRIGDGYLVAYAPGDLPTLFPPGMAKKVPKGCYLVFQMHYTPNGAEQTDRSSIGLIFAKEPPAHEMRTRSIVQNRFVIPPGAGAHKVTSTSTFHKDAVLVSFFPHMHLRGKSFEYRVVFPNGKSEILLSVPHYDFNWQNNYRLEKSLHLPTGTRIDCTAYFDNSPGNPNNPDPTQTVRWGDQTWEEMMIGFVDYYYADGAEARR
jgi:peroxiredoxin